MKMRSTLIVLVSVLIMKTDLSLSAKGILLEKGNSCLSKSKLRAALIDDVYETQVTFSANYKIGDYIEFVGVQPIAAGASGNYEISIAYVRGNVAAGATHLACISHYDPAIWREVGRTNNNDYVGRGYNFTVDCNTEFANPRFRIRAVNILGVLEPIVVYIKVRSINFNNAYKPLAAIGNDLTVNKFLPMSLDWNLYVGNVYTADGANLAIKATSNGNVGIGTANPDAKLAVNGLIHTQEVKVDMKGWADFVFAKDYVLPSLAETEKHIKEKGHLLGIPSAKEVEANGINLGDMNAKLLQKIEELTLHLIEQNKTIQLQQAEIKQQKGDIEFIKSKLK